MKTARCRALKRVLSLQPEPQLVPITSFFDGNDDLGSIGCNLIPHPGIETFREILTGLLKRPDVTAVYAQISELDPGEDCWPFTDTVLIAGSIEIKDLQEILAPLQPDEVGPSTSDFSSLGLKHSGPVRAAWWD